MHILRDEQFTELQGFYLNRPMPVEALEERLVRQMKPSAEADRLTSTLTYEQLRQKLADYEWLERCTTPILSEDDVFAVMGTVRDLFAERFSFDRFGILVGTVNDRYCVVHEMVIRAGMEACPPGSLMIIKATGLERVFQTKSLHYNPDIRLRPEFIEDEELASVGIRSLVRLPLMIRDEVFGVMTVKSVEPNYYSTEDIQLMQRVAKRLGNSIYNLKLIYQLKLQSYQDSLTGVFNRRFCEDVFASEQGLELVDELSQAEWPEAERNLSVLFVDINQFKALNDLAGHAAGDKLLVFAAKMIQNTVENQGFVVRYGGDEFVVVVPGSDSEKAYEMATRLHAQSRSARPTLPNDVSWELTFSIGIASGSTDEVEELIRIADNNMYEAKAKG